MDAAKRLDVAVAAGARVFLGIDLGVAAGKARGDAREIGAPRGDGRVPRAMAIAVTRFGECFHTGQDIAVARECREAHVACFDLRECDRCRAGLGGNEIQRQLRLVRPLAEHGADWRRIGFVVDHDAPAVLCLIDAVEARIESKPADLDTALVLGRDDREAAALLLGFEPGARQAHQALSLYLRKASRQRRGPVAFDARQLFRGLPEQSFEIGALIASSASLLLSCDHACASTRCTSVPRSNASSPVCGVLSAAHRGDATRTP